MSVCVHAYVCMCMHVCVCVGVGVCVFMSACAYVATSFKWCIQICKYIHQCRQVLGIHWCICSMFVIIIKIITVDKRVTNSINTFVFAFHVQWNLCDFLFALWSNI